jgi:prevent-host-death family protein
MAIIVNMHEAKTQLSRLVLRAAAGEEVIIARAGKPIVKLSPLQPAAKARTFGTAKGKIKLRKDFDGPVPGFEAFYR